ncbi:ribose-5-phosphate isomerase RpiA [Sphingomonas qilianensis]|uniref:Ribose-5-phosphate isomerase A n=1 Tax=Sphingomonas qilianensis TaxID=1736690 RepID=A0ABU9XQT9_9SPHN
MADLEAQKQRAALRAAAEVADGMLLGLGTGSTATYAIREIARRMREEGLRLTAIATSSATGALAVSLGIPLRSMGEIDQLDLVIDGADEIDPALRAIKGGGGALFREKIAAAAAVRMIVIGDSSKPVETLGRFKLPVEVHPFALRSVQHQLEALGAPIALRSRADGAPFATDQQANIFDVAFDRIDDAGALARMLEAMPGVLAHGLFIDLVDTAIIGTEDGVSITNRH